MGGFFYIHAQRCYDYDTLLREWSRGNEGLKFDEICIIQLMDNGENMRIACLDWHQPCDKYVKLVVPVRSLGMLEDVHMKKLFSELCDGKHIDPEQVCHMLHILGFEDQSDTPLSCTLP